ncbi:hypothetical protein C6P40_005330 [Pichia californica]|uniref:Uncharacterized protein n=1 Tax=Pichia californica TaxID=460514 RepID=A0A9P6WLD3_9ASCO|nr:hypothetical protein C6P40_005330 [[Candida] californica]
MESEKYFILTLNIENKWARTDSDTVSKTTLTTKTKKTTLTSDTRTWIWVTLTKGVVVYATTTPYYQSFYPMYTTVSTWSSGSVGLGTITGTVGTTRTYRYQ